MSNSPIVRDDVRYVVTEYGREALRARETCECRLVVNGGYLHCADCGTVHKLATYRQHGFVKWREA